MKKEKTWHWPYQRTNSNGAKEYACRHGVGHGGIHGCDGCCQDESFPRAQKKKSVGVLRYKEK